ncbi:MAG: tetratricopeptide repeat protein [Terriglobales bacterium]
MVRRLTFAALLSLLCATLLAVAQNPTTPPEIQTAPPPLRVGPPPANATAEELETKGDQLKLAKQFADALDYYRAASQKKRSAAIFNKIGILELQTLHLKEAEKSFNQAVKADRSAPEGYNNLGAVNYARKKYDKAIKYYKRALRIRETAASFHSNLGTAYFEKKEYDKAAAEYRRALQLDPDIFDRNSQTGIAAHMVSLDDRARFSYQLAKLFATSGDLERSLLYLRRAMEDGYKGIDEVYKDKEFATLRKDPRFTELMAQKPASIPQ